MNNELYRLQGVKGVIELIKTTCEKHDAVAEFQIGSQLENDKSKKLYPVAFLENDISSDVDGDSETFSIALSIGDRLPHDYSSDDAVIGKSKTSQILDEIHYAIENVASNILVTGMNKMYYEDVNQDSLVICRGEFQIEIARFVAKDGDIYLDLPSLPEYGSVSNRIDWTNIVNKPALVTQDVYTADIEAINQQHETDIDTINQAIATKSDSGHTHTEFTTLDEKIDTGLATKSDSGHNHDEFETLDTKITTGLATKSDSGHNHDERYFTQDQVSNLIAGVTTNLDWKGSVATYSALATTYPTPLQGWTVTVNDTQVDYRYNGSVWVDIGNNSAPMADTNTDGRMSKEHYTTVQNLPNTHYTKTESDTKFLDASNLSSGTLNTSRLPVSVMRTDKDNMAYNSIGVTRGAEGGTSSAFTGRLVGNTQPKINIQTNGKIEWGDGSVAVDSNLFRSGVNALRTNSNFYVDLTFQAGNVRTPYIANTVAYVNSRIHFLDTGTDVRTDVANNTPLTIRNTDNTTTKNLTDWIKGTTTIANVTKDGDFAGRYMIATGGDFISNDTDLNLQFNGGTDSAFRAVRAGAFNDAKNSVFFQVGNAVSDESVAFTAKNGVTMDRTLMNTRNLTISNATYSAVPFAIQYILDVQGRTRLQETHIGLTTDVQPKITLNTDGKISFGDGAIATDTVLYRQGAGLLKTDLDLIVGRSLYANTLSNTSSSTNSVVGLSNGVLLQTGIATNVATTIRNTHTSTTGDLTQFIKGSAVVAKVTSSGVVEASGLKINGKDYVDYSYVHPNAVVDIYDIPATEIAKLENATNWTNNRYTGTAIVNTYQGQEYDSITTGYWYKCVAENQWIRR